ncbi:GNAT family N-acetyltransferase [Aquimarina intermedia]|uniref:RimJ/RimL family protein N-acetyltransferase n=1 Tax=Aquimarina intermedia TaxID=350814 RepID=A0A5S5C039_9FLAO|nr:GNAT family protein [Aquimarina intermedia]TYP72811.1 RimJ/RimL family protein N-acetyltransferase [Aquimarina intermedia]
MDLKVRELISKDIPHIVAYWHTSPSDFLEGMGVDLTKLPSRESLSKMLTNQLALPIKERASYALIWECDGVAVGHSNVNAIRYGQQANIHLHLWTTSYRKRGMGTELVKKSLPFYFNNLKLQRLICEPYALNPAPNKTLEKVGFTYEKTYRTIPGSLNFEQDVCRWVLDRERFKVLL